LSQDYVFKERWQMLEKSIQALSFAWLSENGDTKLSFNYIGLVCPKGLVVAIASYILVNFTVLEH
jgi:hypothetical protein